MWENFKISKLKTINIDDIKKIIKENFQESLCEMENQISKYRNYMSGRYDSLTDIVDMYKNTDLENIEAELECLYNTVYKNRTYDGVTYYHKTQIVDCHTFELNALIKSKQVLLEMGICV